MKRGNAYGDKRTRHVQNKKSTTFFTAVDILHEQRVFTCSKTKSVLKNNVCVQKCFSERVTPHVENKHFSYILIKLLY